MFQFRLQSNLTSLSFLADGRKIAVGDASGEPFYTVKRFITCSHARIVDLVMCCAVRTGLVQILDSRTSAPVAHAKAHSSAITLLTVAQRPKAGTPVAAAGAAKAKPTEVPKPAAVEPTSPSSAPKDSPAPPVTSPIPSRTSLAPQQPSFASPVPASGATAAADIVPQPQPSEGSQFAQPSRISGVSSVASRRSASSEPSTRAPFPAIPAAVVSPVPAAVAAKPPLSPSAGLHLQPGFEAAGSRRSAPVVAQRQAVSGQYTKRPSESVDSLPGSSSSSTGGVHVAHSLDSAVSHGDVSIGIPDHVSASRGAQTPTSVSKRSAVDSQSFVGASRTAGSGMSRPSSVASNRTPHRELDSHNPAPFDPIPSLSADLAAAKADVAAIASLQPLALSAPAQEAHAASLQHQSSGSTTGSVLSTPTTASRALQSTAVPTRQSVSGRSVSGKSVGSGRRPSITSEHLDIPVRQLEPLLSSADSTTLRDVIVGVVEPMFSTLQHSVKNLHLEVLRQMHVQRRELAAQLQGFQTQTASMSAELEALRGENARLRQLWRE